MSRADRARLLSVTEGEDAQAHRLVAEIGISAAAAQLAPEIDGEKVLGDAAERGIRLVIPGDEEWPTQLEDLPTPPWGLFVRGAEDLRMIAARSVAIVGSRAATGYGLRVACDLAADLSERGWSVISGLAFGIDAAAHRGALAVNGSTAAVLAGGLDAIYPSAHAQLGERILDAGVLVSEVPMGRPPMRHRFLTRNRIIAALTRGTVIVEAAERSGSLRTAAAAEQLLRPVMAVPGTIHAPSSAGTHRWIAQRRAELVTSAADILEIVGQLAPVATQDSLLPSADLLQPREEAVLAAMSTRPQRVDQIASTLGREVREVMAGLGILAMLGMVRHEQGRWILVA